jgi:hypothetical protein
MYSDILAENVDCGYYPSIEEGARAYLGCGEFRFFPCTEGLPEEAGS